MKRQTRVRVTMIQGYGIKDIFRIFKAAARLNAVLRRATPEEQDRIMSYLLTAPGVTQAEDNLPS